MLKTSFLNYLVQRKAEYVMNVKDQNYDEYLRRFPSVASAHDGQDFLIKAHAIEDGKISYPFIR